MFVSYVCHIIFVLC